MLKIEGLTVEVPGFVLRDVNLEIAKGEFFAIMGPTGSGKSLLVEAITGLLPSNMLDFEGSIWRNGKEITHLPPNRRNIGILYQDVALFPHMTVEQNISYGLRYCKGNGANAQKRFQFFVKRFDLGHILHRYPARISGGERQRVALARVLVLDPDVVLLDEPISGLDPLFQGDIRRLLRQLHSELGITFVMVSHDFEEVMYLAQKGAVIHQGQVVQQAQIDEIFNRPASTFVARFVGAKNVFKVRFENGLAYIGSTSVRIADACLVPDFDHIVIRPEKIVPVLDMPDIRTGLENMFWGKVLEMSYCNFSVHLKIQKDETIFRAVWPEIYVRKMGLHVGKKVGFAFNKADVSTFREAK